MTLFLKHKIIIPHEFAFQSKVSTSHAMLDFVKVVFDNIDHNLQTGLVLIELKVFDTFGHKILLNRLAHYCIREMVVKLSSSYLNYGKQLVNLN